MTSAALIGAWRNLRGPAATTDTASIDLITTDSGVENWNCPGHNPTKTAAVPTARAPQFDPETAHQIQPEDGTVDTSPAIDGDHVFVTTSEEALLGVALNSGDTEWTTDFDAETTTPPVVSDQLVVVGTDEGVHAHRHRDGEERWTQSVEGVTTVVADDAVFVGTDTGVQAHRPAGGNRKWQTDCEGSVTALAVADGVIYAASDQSVTTLDATTGDRHWRIDAPGRDPCLAVGDVLVVSARSELSVHDPETGEQRWTDDEGGQPTAVALAHGRVYQTTDTAVRALDDQTGTENWRTPLNATTGPIVVGDTVYVGTEGDLVALDADDGEYQFTHDLPGVQGSLAVVGNAILCRIADGALSVVTANLGGRPNLHATTTESEKEGETDTDEDDTETADTPTPVTPASRFARDCDAVTDARLVSESGPIHVYNGTITDSEGETDARIYALAPEYADDEEAVTAFETAAREWQSISKNKHIATVYETGSEPRPWIAFDAGHDNLDDAVAGLNRTERVDVLLGVAEAMRTGSMYNLAHGGLTPATVFLADDLEGDQIATVADWGLERAVRDAVDESLVTPYTAPEQLGGVNATAVDTTDIYRLGTVAYRVLTGEQPFAGVADLSAAITGGDLTQPTGQDPTLPDDVDDILADAMAVDPADRLASPYDLRQRLLGAMDD